MSMLLRIAQRVINRPLLVHPDKVPFILDVLQGRIPIGDVSDLKGAALSRLDQLPEEAKTVFTGRGPEASRFVGSPYEVDEAGRPVNRLPYRRTADGVAIVTVTGSLINRGAWVGSYSGETSYEGIKHQVSSAAADPKVHSILLDIESPGGEAVGAMEAAAAVRAAGKQKPVTAVVNGMAASAAYAIASGAQRIVTTPTGVSGSIGVVLLHADYSRALDREGITPTLIFAGAHKVDANPFAPLSDDVKSDLQREVNSFYDLFVEAVSAGRKGLTPRSIRATEARTFIGKEAVDAGLADAVGTFEDVLAELTRGSKGRSSAQKGSRMSEQTGVPAAEAGNETTKIEATAPAAAPAANAEVERIKAILSCDEAKGREAHAQRFACETDMSVAAAKVALAAIPLGSAAVPPVAERSAELITANTNAKASEPSIWPEIVGAANKRRAR